MAHSINIGGQLYTDEEYQKLLQTKKYPQCLSQDRHCGYTIINKRIYYIYN